MKTISLLGAIILIGAMMPAKALADEDVRPTVMAEMGRALVETHCGECHAVDGSGQSPHDDAPPFRTLGNAYPVSHLAESLAEGIMTGHPDMPVMSFEPDEVDQIIAWLETIQEN